MIITHPTLILDKEKCCSNIRWMLDKATQHNVKFRPHFKTHQSIVVGEWFREAGVKSITVSSMRMAEYFGLMGGWEDITVAVSYNILDIERTRHVASQVRLNLVVESPDTVVFLKKNLKCDAGIFIKIDAGYHRTGILHTDTAKIDAVANEICNASNLEFKGFLAHSGHTYQAKSKEEILTIHNESKQILSALKDRYRSSFGTLENSIGDTPGCSVADNFGGIDEIRPGNFVFYDVMQHYLGSCSVDRIALVLACPVIARHQERNELVIYGGAVHLSKEFVFNSDGEKIFGLVTLISHNGWSEPVAGAYIKSVSQEHGIIKAPSEFINTINAGDVVGILPVHSCLTANLMKGYITFDDQQVDHLSRHC